MTTKDGADSRLKRTPLYEQHQAAGARLVEFGGWEMPVQYSGILAEHQAVRTRAGLFDVCHMGEFRVEGEDALAFLQYLVPNDVARLKIGQALYTQLCRPDGNVIDDLLIYYRAQNLYMLVVNAANIATDFAWVQGQAQRFPRVTLTDQSETTGLLALQGPLALQILRKLTDVDLAAIRYYHFVPGVVAGKKCIVSRTGYTGEDGFELYSAAGDVVPLWQSLLEAGKPEGLVPAGLGARDTLRLEAGLCLYGHELDTQTNPLEARLGWTVKLNKGSEFIGAPVLRQVKAQGPAKLLVGLELLDRGIPRNGYLIFSGERQIGIITSGAPGPTVQKNIAMGYVEPTEATPGNQVAVEIRGKRIAAQIVPLPFYKR